MSTYNDFLDSVDQMQRANHSHDALCWYFAVIAKVAGREGGMFGGFDAVDERDEKRVIIEVTQLAHKLGRNARQDIVGFRHALAEWRQQRRNGEQFRREAVDRIYPAPAESK